jgi:2,3-bisphosphoglycerate-independent phosphoglycerate mutase
MNNRVVLMILDGWGIAKDKNVSAIDKANTIHLLSIHFTPNTRTTRLTHQACR